MEKETFREAASDIDLGLIGGEGYSLNPPLQAVPDSLDSYEAATELAPDFSGRRFGHLLRNRRILLYLSAVILLIAAAILAIQSFGDLEDLGYLGIFSLNFASSASLFIPIGPGGISTLLGGALLTPVVVGLVAGTGSTLGELSGYAVGHGGHQIIRKRKAYSRMEPWVRRHGFLVLFLLAVLPSPLFDLAGLVAGGIGYPLRRFLLAVWVGKVIHTTGMAFMGAWGAAYVFPWLQGLFS